MKLIVSILCASLAFISLGQSQFTLKMKIESIKDKHATLWSYYGNEEKFVDSIRFGENGLAIYRSKEKLTRGLYKVVLPNTNSFELIVSEPKVVLSTNVVTSVKSMKIKKSVENQVYYKLKHFIIDHRNQIVKYNSQYRKGSISQLQFESKKDSLQKVIDQEKIRVIESNPDLVVSTLVKAEMNPTIDQNIKDPYIKYINDFVAQIDFNKVELLYSPVLIDRVDQLLDDVVAPYPSERIKMIDQVFEEVTLKETKVYLTDYLINKYRKLSQLGDDEVFVHLMDKYSSHSKLDEEVLKTYRAQAEALKPFLRGERFPEEFVKLDFPLDSIDFKYTLVILWNKEATTKELNLLFDFSQSYARKGLKVLSIAIGGDQERLNIGQKNRWYHGTMDEFYDSILIAQGESIQLIFLDKNKKILARDIALDDLIDTLDAWEK